MIKMQFVLENMHERLLGFDHMHWGFVLYFFWNYREKSGIFNIGTVSYSVSLQSNIK